MAVHSSLPTSPKPVRVVLPIPSMYGKYTIHGCYGSHCTTIQKERIIFQKMTNFSRPKFGDVSKVDLRDEASSSRPQKIAPPKKKVYVQSSHGSVMGYGKSPFDREMFPSNVVFPILSIKTRQNRSFERHFMLNWLV